MFRDRLAVGEDLESRLAEWRRLLRASTTQGRAVLQRVLRGRIVFTPCGNGYTFEAPTRFDTLFTGIAVPRPAFIERGNRGAEHIGPDDTFDADYGRLLERASARVVAERGKWDSSPPGFVPTGTTEGSAGCLKRGGNAVD